MSPIVIYLSTGREPLLRGGAGGAPSHATDIMEERLRQFSLLRVIADAVPCGAVAYRNPAERGPPLNTRLCESLIIHSKTGSILEALEWNVRGQKRKAVV